MKRFLTLFLLLCLLGLTIPAPAERQSVDYSKDGITIQMQLPASWQVVPFLTPKKLSSIKWGDPSNSNNFVMIATQDMWTEFEHLDVPREKINATFALLQSLYGDLEDEESFEYVQANGLYFLLSKGSVDMLGSHATMVSALTVQRAVVVMFFISAETESEANEILNSISFPIT